MTADIRGDGLGRTYDTQGKFRGRTDNIRGDGQLTLGGTDSWYYGEWTTNIGGTDS